MVGLALLIALLFGIAAALVDGAYWLFKKATAPPDPGEQDKDQ